VFDDLLDRIGHHGLDILARDIERDIIVPSALCEIVQRKVRRDLPPEVHILLGEPPEVTKPKAPLCAGRDRWDAASGEIPQFRMNEIARVASAVGKTHFNGEFLWSFRRELEREKEREIRRELPSIKVDAAAERLSLDWAD
jgi:hypothetical protein